MALFPHLVAAEELLVGQPLVLAGLGVLGGVGYENGRLELLQHAGTVAQRKGGGLALQRRLGGEKAGAALDRVVSTQQVVLVRHLLKLGRERKMGRA